MNMNRESFVCIASTTAWNGMAFLCSRPDRHPLEGQHWGQDRKSMITCSWVGDASVVSVRESRRPAGVGVIDEERAGSDRLEALLTDAIAQKMGHARASLWQHHDDGYPAAPVDVAYLVADLAAVVRGGPEPGSEQPMTMTVRCPICTAQIACTARTFHAANGPERFTVDIDYHECEATSLVTCAAAGSPTTDPLGHAASCGYLDWHGECTCAASGGPEGDTR